MIEVFSLVARGLGLARAIAESSRSTATCAVFACALATSLNACSSDAGDSAGEASSGAIYECGAELDLRDSVELEYRSEQAPSPTGGELETGTYSLTRWVLYGATESGPSRRLKGAFKLEADQTGVALGAEGANEPTPNSFTWEVVDRNVVLGFTCPAVLEGKREGRPYSASPTTVSFFTDDGTVLTYTKQ